MKKIIVKWIRIKPTMLHDMEMRVLFSDHKRFVPGSRFDFGFLQIASKQGYTIEILPLGK